MSAAVRWKLKSAKAAARKCSYHDGNFIGFNAIRCNAGGCSA